MIPVTEMYSRRFFRGRDKLMWRAPIVCGAMQKIFSPKSVMDVGCAIGDFVAEFSRMGIRAEGIEGATGATDYLVCQKGKVHCQDLRLPIIDFGRFDLVICFEVAEHIDPEFANTFVRNLTKLSDTICMSAAGPGQGGHFHVNCQPTDYWIELMDKENFIFQIPTVEAIREEWKSYKTKKEMSSYYNNLLVFERDRYSLA